MRALGIALCLTLIACAGPVSSDTAAPGQPKALRPGLQYSGAIALVAVAPGNSVRTTEVSAPLLPNVIVWQYKGGDGYPTTAAQREELARDIIYTYDGLLRSCQADYPGITLAAPGESLTPDELATNYDQVARCSYEKFGAKPYWVPQFLNDVDLCALKLGADWRLPSQADFEAFTDDDFRFFRDTLSIGHGDDWFPRETFFSLDLYLRGQDGSLKVGSLDPESDHVLKSLSVDPAELSLEGAGVRCVRTNVATAP